MIKLKKINLFFYKLFKIKRKCTFCLKMYVPEDIGSTCPSCSKWAVGFAIRHGNWESFKEVAK